MSKTRLTVPIFALLAAACGRTDPMSPASPPDSGPLPDATQRADTARQEGDVGGLTGINAFEASCWDSTQLISTVPDTTCATASDCKEVTEVSCGFSKVFAVAKSAECEPYPAPPCAPLTNSPTPYYWLAQTGDSTENVDAIALRCLAGKCQT